MIPIIVSLLYAIPDMLIAYYAFFHLLGVVTLVPWILKSATWGSIIDADGQSRAWW